MVILASFRAIIHLATQLSRNAVVEAGMDEVMALLQVKWALESKFAATS